MYSQTLLKSNFSMESEFLSFSMRKSFYLNTYLCAGVSIKHKQTSLSAYKMILLKIKIPCVKKKIYGKVFSSILKFTVVYCNKL